MGDARGRASRSAAASPDGLMDARMPGVCGYCRGQFPAGTEIAPHRRVWGHARCVGALRPDVRAFLETRGSSHPDVEIPLLIAMAFRDAGDDDAAARYTAEAQEALGRLVAPLPPPGREEEPLDDWQPPDPLLGRAVYLLREVGGGAVAGTALMVAAGRCLQQVEPGHAADMIRGTHIAEPPEGPATPEAASARHALGLLAEASRVGQNGDEDWVRCQELLIQAAKTALDVRPPACELPSPEGGATPGPVTARPGRRTRRGTTRK